MNEKRFAKQLALLRKESGMTQEDLAGQLHISPQAVSKWENGHSLPETALLPELARLMNATIDELFSDNNLTIIEALYGDGIETTNVTKRLNRLLENDTLHIEVSSSLLGVSAPRERPSFLTLKYQSEHGVCYSAFTDREIVSIRGNDMPNHLPNGELSIIAGRYGTQTHNYDVMRKIEHYKLFNWKAYPANHETFPSVPANDKTEFLTLVYLNETGIHIATCAEGESLAYYDNETGLTRQFKGKECFIPDVPELPPFGDGMECSWAAALTAALQAMKIKTNYDEVMGVSGACYRIAFCSPGWDYSSVDGLVVYDYATPGFAAFGYTPEQYGHIEKADRAEHRQKITKEIRSNMPVLGINLRVAPEWGIICGYEKEGEDLFCRTKYDKQTIENDQAFMKGSLAFDSALITNHYNYLYVDNWPFLLCYFSQKRKPPTPNENLLTSLKVFIDCAKKECEDGYFMGFKAYETWIADLKDDIFYETCDDEQIARRFSVNQFCVLSLFDARKSASLYMKNGVKLFDSMQLPIIAELFGKVASIAGDMHKMLDSGTELDGRQSRQFWTLEKRHKQADALGEMAQIEKEAIVYAIDFVSKYDY